MQLLCKPEGTKRATVWPWTQHIAQQHRSLHSPAHTCHHKGRCASASCHRLLVVAVHVCLHRRARAHQVAIAPHVVHAANMRPELVVAHVRRRVGCQRAGVGAIPLVLQHGTCGVRSVLQRVVLYNVVTTPFRETSHRLCNNAMQCVQLGGVCQTAHRRSPGGC